MQICRAVLMGRRTFDQGTGRKTKNKCFLRKKKRDKKLATHQITNKNGEEKGDMNMHMYTERLMHSWEFMFDETFTNVHIDYVSHWLWHVGVLDSAVYLLCWWPTDSCDDDGGSEHNCGNSIYLTLLLSLLFLLYSYILTNASCITFPTPFIVTFKHYINIKILWVTKTNKFRAAKVQPC